MSDTKPNRFGCFSVTSELLEKAEFNKLSNFFSYFIIRKATANNDTQCVDYVAWSPLFAVMDGCEVPEYTFVAGVHPPEPILVTKKK